MISPDRGAQSWSAGAGEVACVSATRTLEGGLRELLVVVGVVQILLAVVLRRDLEAMRCARAQLTRVTEGDELAPGEHTRRGGWRGRSLDTHKSVWRLMDAPCAIRLPLDEAVLVLPIILVREVNVEVLVLDQAVAAASKQESAWDII